MSPRRATPRRVNKHAKTLHCVCGKSYTRADHYERHIRTYGHSSEYLVASESLPDPTEDSRYFYCSCGAGFTAEFSFHRHCRTSGHPGDWLRSRYQPKGHQSDSSRFNHEAQGFPVDLEAVSRADPTPPQQIQDSARYETPHQSFEHGSVGTRIATSAVESKHSGASSPVTRQTSNSHSILDPYSDSFSGHPIAEEIVSESLVSGTSAMADTINEDRLAAEQVLGEHIGMRQQTRQQDTILPSIKPESSHAHEDEQLCQEDLQVGIQIHHVTGDDGVEDGTYDHQESPYEELKEAPSDENSSESPDPTFRFDVDDEQGRSIAATRVEVTVPYCNNPIQNSRLEEDAIVRDRLFKKVTQAATRARCDSPSLPNENGYVDLELDLPHLHGRSSSWQRRERTNYAAAPLTEGSRRSSETPKPTARSPRNGAGWRRQERRMGNWLEDCRRATNAGVQKARRVSGNIPTLVKRHKGKLLAILAVLAGMGCWNRPPTVALLNGSHEWLLDSTAQRHVAMDSSLFSNVDALFAACPEPRLGRPCDWSGVVPLEFKSGKTLVLDDVLFRPHSNINILSLAKLGEAGMSGEWTAGGLSINNMTDNGLIGRAVNFKSQYLLAELALPKRSTDYPSRPKPGTLQLADHRAASITELPTNGSDATSKDNGITKSVTPVQTAADAIPATSTSLGLRSTSIVDSKPWGFKVNDWLPWAAATSNPTTAIKIYPPQQSANHIPVPTLVGSPSLGLPSDSSTAIQNEHAANTFVHSQVPGFFTNISLPHINLITARYSDIQPSTSTPGSLKRPRSEDSDDPNRLPKKRPFVQKEKWKKMKSQLVESEEHLRDAQERAASWKFSGWPRSPRGWSLESASRIANSSASKSFVPIRLSTALATSIVKSFPWSLSTWPISQPMWSAIKGLKPHRAPNATNNAIAELSSSSGAFRTRDPDLTNATSCVPEPSYWKGGDEHPADGSLPKEPLISVPSEKLSFLPYGIVPRSLGTGVGSAAPPFSEPSPTPFKPQPTPTPPVITPTGGRRSRIDTHRQVLDSLTETKNAVAEERRKIEEKVRETEHRACPPCSKCWVPALF